MSTVTHLGQKLKQHKSTLAQSKSKLSGLRSERAKLAVADREKNKTKITSLNKQISQLEFDLQNLPSEIEVLESDLAAATEKQKQAKRSKLLSAQKKAARQVETLSHQFVSDLEKAVDINNKLRTAYDEYLKIQRQTNESVISKKICRPSYGMLRYVFEICSKELSGSGQILRRALPVGCPPI